MPIPDAIVRGFSSLQLQKKAHWTCMCVEKNTNLFWWWHKLINDIYLGMLKIIWVHVIAWEKSRVRNKIEFWCISAIRNKNLPAEIGATLWRCWWKYRSTISTPCENILYLDKHIVPRMQFSSSFFYFLIGFHKIPSTIRQASFLKFLSSFWKFHQFINLRAGQLIFQYMQRRWFT